MNAYSLRGFLIAIALTWIAPCSPAGDEISIVPQPAQVSRHTGHFNISPQTQIVYFTANKEMRSTVELFAKRLRAATGFPLPIRNAEQMPGGDYFFFNYIREEELGDEGYELGVDPQSVEINANNESGFFYGMQTLLQLLPAEAYSPSPVHGIRWEIPCLTITDRPRFRWRGMHLDVSRHFFPKEFIYTYLDMIALHKMNVFHWHLTDDQGWRIEIKKYPRLTEIGAWRADRETEPWDGRAPQRAGEQATYGGFYTQDDIRDVVKYASDRHITVVPEIEMPAHATAALSAYPRFSCTGQPYTVVTGGIWPNVNLFCAGNDSTFIFLQDVLAEVVRLFPGSYIHIGGDEADKTHWKACPRCQARLRTEGLRDEDELQSWFIRRIEKFLASKQRRLIGWDEVLEGGLPPMATVMSWRGTTGGIEAARQKHDVVMTPTSHCYFDYYQGNRELEPRAGGGYTPLEKVYQFEPVPDSLDSSQARHILGGQANVWSEYIPTASHAQYMTMPRMAAMAEVLWSPKESRNWASFIPRVERQMRRYEAAGYSYAPSVYQVAISPLPDTTLHGVGIAMGEEFGSPEIRFTLDGSEPTAASERYSRPLTMEKSAKVCAAAFRDAKELAGASIQNIVVHKALYKRVLLSNPCDRRYPGNNEYCLTDGFQGGTWPGDGNWQGFLGTDFDAYLDLGAKLPIHRISTDFLQNADSLVFCPVSVQYYVSDDRNEYTLVGEVKPFPLGEGKVPSVRSFPVDIKDATARYVKVRAKNPGTVPAGYPGQGGKAWILVDEIIVE